MIHKLIGHISVKQIALFAICLITGISAKAQWAVSGSDIYNTNSGNVGIGTTTPLTRFDVWNGDMSLTSTTSLTSPAINFTVAGAQLGKIWGDNWNGGPVLPMLCLSSNDNTPDITIDHVGNVGIGTTNPEARLHVEFANGEALEITQTGNAFPVFTVGEGKAGVNVDVSNITQTTFTVASGATATTYLDVVNGFSNSSQIRFINPFSLVPRHSIVDDPSTNMMIIYPNPNGGCSDVVTIKGKLLLGSQSTPTPAGYTLYATEGILTEKVKVAVETTNDWSDFVFDKNYNLPTLQEVEDYIKDNGRLPGIPSAEDVTCEGVDLGKMDAKLLQKIEELTLYVLDLKRENEKQQQVINRLVIEETTNENNGKGNN